MPSSTAPAMAGLVGENLACWLAPLVFKLQRNVSASPALSTRLFLGEHKFLGAAHWVGAIKRDTEGSHMQLQGTVCREIKAVLWSLRGAFLESQSFHSDTATHRLKLSKIQSESVLS